jgi:hypothetical protein
MYKNLTELPLAISNYIKYIYFKPKKFFGKIKIFHCIVVDPHWFQSVSGSGSSILGQCGMRIRIHEGSPSYRRSHQPLKKHPALQKLKISSLFYFGGSFLASWIGSGAS